MLLLQCWKAQQSQQHIGRQKQNASQQQGFQLQQQLAAAGICHEAKNKQQQQRQRQQQQQHHRRERKRLNPDDPAQEDGCVITISDSEAACNAGCDVTGGAEQTSGRISGPEQHGTPAAVDAVGGNIADGQHVEVGQQPAVQQQEQLAAGRLSGSSIRSCSNRRSSSTSSNGAPTGTQRVTSLSSSPATTADLLRDQRQQLTQSVAAAEETSASSSLEHDGHDQDSDYNPEEAADTAAAAGIGGDDGVVADEDSDLDFEPLNPQPKRHKLCVVHHRSDGSGGTSSSWLTYSSW
jgi:hypothetical protein